MEKIELNKELFEFYEGEYKGNWGKMIRDWRHWMDWNLNNSDDEKLKEEFFDEIDLNLGTLVTSDIIPMLITREAEIVKKQEPKKWTVYFDQHHADGNTSRYFYWDGEHIKQTDDLSEVPFLTGKQAQKAPNFMKTLVKRGK